MGTLSRPFFGRLIVIHFVDRSYRRRSVGCVLHETGRGKMPRLRSLGRNSIAVIIHSLD